MPFGLTDTWLPLLAATAFFVLLHVLAIARLEPVYPRAFKLSRGAAALVLTALGIGALVGGSSHWQEAFLYRHQPGDWMRLGLLTVYGHLLADFLWMGWGKWRFGIRPRKDLILHHGLGIVGFGAALVLEVGYAIALLTMITELLPLTTGVNAWGKRVAAPRIVDVADRARLYVLAWLRLPLWLALFGLVVLALLSGHADRLQLAYYVAGSGLLCLVALDCYWIGKCRQSVDFY
ncbi:MAG: hypothetical protein P1V81_04215 [Planctomycetota bacterium]|nr:hypothetical protein [Planctomycetota bacterium]